METRTVIRAVVAVVCIGGTLLGLENTYGDNSDVKALAQKTACGSPTCSISVLRESRSALSQAFSFQTTLAEKGKSERSASVDVECKRKQLLLGDYVCAITSGGLPGASSAQ
ncbi:MAG TPA: hypothetical protein VK745_16735 [Polyangiaceae bacterium]|jgi:hypothetical protein|nr:hypothetical protein [Polyangiaceae bacterium]